MPITNSSVNSVNGGINLTNVTGKNVDVSEYLEFFFIEKVWFKDNDGISPNEPGRWLRIPHKTGRLPCYHILINIGKVIPRSMVNRVTNI